MLKSMTNYSVCKNRCAVIKLQDALKAVEDEPEYPGETNALLDILNEANKTGGKT